MPEKVMKITYHGESKKINAYLRMPSDTLLVLRREIELYLFREHMLVQPSLTRVFWIDDENDEIEIIHQIDYEIFVNICKSNCKNLHLHIAPVVADKTETPKKTKAEKTDAASAPNDGSNQVKHTLVTCDACQVNPVVGFRYKCIQCPNFDLCQRCEAAHKHPEHMMVRMPTYNCPSVVDAWITGPDTAQPSRRHSRRARGQCPFSESTAGPSKKDGHREKRHSRRIGGMLSEFVDMMVNLPESNVSATTTATTTAPTTTAAKEEETEKITKSNLNANEEKTTQSKDTAVQVESMEQEPATSANPQNEPQPEEPSISSSAKEEFQATPTMNTPTTPILNFENLLEIVPPENLRAGLIDVLNNFSKMFGKMLDPTDGATAGVSGMRKDSTYSMDSASSSASTNTEPEKVDKPNEKTLEETTAQIPNESLLKTNAESTEESQTQQQQRAESMDQDWQIIGSSTTEGTTSNDASINGTSLAAEALTPEVYNFGKLVDQLKHVVEEKHREEAATQTVVDSTATSTSSVDSNASATAETGTPKPDEIRCVYHSDNRINDAIHAMMAMGFSNEGAWLTQLLEMVGGDIEAALDNMSTSQTHYRR